MANIMFESERGDYKEARQVREEVIREGGGDVIQFRSGAARSTNEPVSE